MKILFTRFPLESAFGGAEVQTLSLMSELHKRGHAVAFLGSCPVMIAECKKRGFPTAVLDIGAPPVTKWSAISFAWRQFQMKQKLLTALSTFEKLDAIVMLSLSEKLLATEWAAEHGTKVIWLEHDRVGAWLRQNPWLPKLKQRSKKAKVVVVSDLSKKLYLDLGLAPENVVAIPNGIDLERFGTAAPIKTDAGELKIGCVSRLGNEKGVDVLISAVTSVPNARLQIVGRGKEEKNLLQAVAETGQGHRISMMDTVEDLGSFYRSLDVLVLPSRDHDPFGLVAAESMALGIPAIVTSVCGITSYLHDGIDAFIVQPDNVDALATALGKLQDPVRRQKMGEEAKATAQKLFSVEKMADEYEKILR